MFSSLIPRSIRETFSKLKMKRRTKITPYTPEVLQVPITPIKTLDEVRKWKENPNFHPINNAPITISISPKDFYVKLYKESIKILVKDRIDKKKELDDKDDGVLSIEDCKYIRKNLPDAHIHVVDMFDYDHLFIKYFIVKKIYKHDENYIAYGTNIFLYLELYKIIKRKTILKSLLTSPISPTLLTSPTSPTLPTLLTSPISPTLLTSPTSPISPPIRLSKLKNLPSSSSSHFQKQNIPILKDFLTGNINKPLFMKSEISMSNIMNNLCKDIYCILYLNVDNLTKENYSNVIKNFRVLKYVYNIYNIAGDESKFILIDNITKFISKNFLYLYNNLISKINKNKDGSNFEFTIFFPILINIYDKIILLYDYFFPYYFYEGIYEKNCIGTKDPINMELFDDNDDINNGKVIIIPNYKENKITNYQCFLTEELYRSLLNNIEYYGIQYKNKPLKNPFDNMSFTKKDVKHITDKLLEHLLNNVKQDEGINFLKELLENELLKVCQELQDINNNHPTIELISKEIKKKENEKRNLQIALQLILENPTNSLTPYDIVIENMDSINVYLKYLNDHKIEYNNCLLIKNLKYLKHLLEQLIALANSGESFKNLLEKEGQYSFKIFLQETLETSVYAITKKEDEIDNMISILSKDSTRKQRLNKILKEKHEHYLRETGEYPFSFFTLLDYFNETIKNKKDNIFETKPDNLAIIEKYSMILGINLGTKDTKILFNVVNRYDDKTKKAHYNILDIPIFNYKYYNDTLYILLTNKNSLYKIIEKNPFEVSNNDTVIEINKIDINITNDPDKAAEVYNKYYNILEKEIKKTLQTDGGGRKKRIIKSKKDITKNKNSKKPKRRSKKTI